MSDVFLDATALLALGNTRDKYHAQASRVNEILSRSGTRFVMTNLVLLEVINLLVKNLNLPHLAAEVADSVWVSRSSGRLRLVFVDEELWQRGWQLLQARPDKQWDLTDCISFTVMTDRAIQRAFTADRHFEQAGFERLLKD